MRRSLPRFVELSLDHKHRNHLQDQCHDDEEEDQNAEHLVLETLLSVVGHEEREPNEEGLCSELAFASWCKQKDGGTYGADCQQRFRIEISRGTPVLLERPSNGVEKLIRKRCRKLRKVGLVNHFLSVLWILLEALQLRLNAFVFVAGAPGARPIDVRFHSRRSADGLQHPFGRVGVCGRGRAALTDEVVNECFRVSANVSEVDSSSAFG